MPRGAGGRRTDPGCGWVLGRVWLISYGAGCWVGAQGGCCARPAPLGLGLGFGLDLGLAAQWEARTGLLAPLALQGVEAGVDQATGPGQSPNHPRSWRGASSSTRTRDIHAQAVPAGALCPAGCSPPAPLSWLKGSGGQSSAGCRQGIPLPPSAACKAAPITHQDPAQHGGDAGGLGPCQHEEWL